MNRGINLSQGSKRSSTTLKKSFYISVGLFCLVVIASLCLIVYRLILKGFYDNLEVREQILNSQLLLIQDKRDKFYETKKRISEIRNIISKRSSVTARVQTLAEFVPVDSTLTSLSGDAKELSFSLQSESIASLNELIEKKIIEFGSDKKKGVSKIEMQSFGLNPKTLQYNVSLQVVFN